MPALKIAKRLTPQHHKPEKKMALTWTGVTALQDMVSMATRQVLSSTRVTMLHRRFAFREAILPIRCVACSLFRSGKIVFTQQTHTEDQTQILTPARDRHLPLVHLTKLQDGAEPLPGMRSHQQWCMQDMLAATVYLLGPGRRRWLCTRQDRPVFP